MLNIKGFNPYIWYEIPSSCFVFSGGEVQVKLDMGNAPLFFERIKIQAGLHNSNDIMELCLAVDALRRVYGSSVAIDAEIPYLPYARQDRAMVPGESLSLKVLTDILNSLNFRSINVWDAHSDVSLALLHNSYNIEVNKLLDHECLANSILVSPDAGSLKKVSSVAKQFGKKLVRADKTRSVIDGSITGTVVYSEHVGDTDFLIIDDICDGGRTFIELAKELRKLTNGKILLYVTHGIFAKGLDVLTEHIDHIYCANPFPGVDLNNTKLTILGRKWQ